MCTTSTSLLQHISPHWRPDLGPPILAPSQRRPSNAERPTHTHTSLTLLIISHNEEKNRLCCSQQRLHAFSCERRAWPPPIHAAEIFRCIATRRTNLLGVLWAPSIYYRYSSDLWLDDFARVSPVLLYVYLVQVEWGAESRIWTGWRASLTLTCVHIYIGIRRRLCWDRRKNFLLVSPAFLTRSNLSLSLSPSPSIPSRPSNKRRERERNLHAHQTRFRLPLPTMYVLRFRPPLPPERKRNLRVWLPWHWHGGGMKHRSTYGLCRWRPKM